MLFDYTTTAHRRIVTIEMVFRQVCNPPDGDQRRGFFSTGSGALTFGREYIGR